jgi:TRAP-type mannitol/chloroaromatic compound transport system permease small subunit
MRYIFNHPTIWAHELSAFLYAVVFLLGGSYALRWNSHISVEILYMRLKPRTRAVLDLFTWVLFYLFVGLLFWEGAQFAFKSVRRMELAGSVWDPPIWPIKLCIPIGALLMLLQGSVKTIKDIHLAFTGRELDVEKEAGKGDLS